MFMMKLTTTLLLSLRSVTSTENIDPTSYTICVLTGWCGGCPSGHYPITLSREDCEVAANSIFLTSPPNPFTSATPIVASFDLIDRCVEVGAESDITKIGDKIDPSAMDYHPKGCFFNRYTCTVQFNDGVGGEQCWDDKNVGSAICSDKITLGPPYISNRFSEFCNNGYFPINSSWEDCEVAAKETYFSLICDKVDLTNIYKGADEKKKSCHGRLRGAFITNMTVLYTLTMMVLVVKRGMKL